MKTTKLQELINLRYGEHSEVTHLEAKPLHREEKGNQSWRDYLVNSMKRRLVGAIERGVSVLVIEETQSFIHHLEQFDKPNILYSFSVSSPMTIYSGWAIDDEIVFCLQNTK